MLQKKELQGSMEAYKMALRLNPQDDEARYNLAVVQKMIQDEEEQGGGEQDQQEDQQEHNKNSNNRNNNRNRMTRIRRNVRNNPTNRNRCHAIMPDNCFRR